MSKNPKRWVRPLVVTLLVLVGGVYWLSTWFFMYQKFQTGKGFLESDALKVVSMMALGMDKNFPDAAVIKLSPNFLETETCKKNKHLVGRNHKRIENCIIPWHGNKNIYDQVCNRYVYEHCVVAEIDTEILEYPNIFGAVVQALSKPCEFLDMSTSPEQRVKVRSPKNYGYNYSALANALGCSDSSRRLKVVLALYDWEHERKLTSILIIHQGR